MSDKQHDLLPPSILISFDGKPFHLKIFTEEKIFLRFNLFIKAVEKLSSSL